MTLLAMLSVPMWNFESAGVVIDEYAVHSHTTYELNIYNNNYFS